jgi:hypothetical protein
MLPSATGTAAFGTRRSSGQLRFKIKFFRQVRPEPQIGDSASLPRITAMRCTIRKAVMGS